ncbi:MAG: Ig-like domain-containing protein [Flavobacteriia bacterium]
MARILALICCIFLVVSCGQIGTISGGPKDEIAPQITSSNLRDKQLNFSEKVIEFTFDEYIELNKAAEQIVLVPADSKLQSKLTKKTLSISFEDSLQKNTTYTIYLNAAVKDATEGNDSLMKFTFSTGKVIDSLGFHCSVYDAYSKALLPKVTVGLYAQWGDVKPRYFAQSNSKGIVSLEALKEGDYFVKSFVDVNQDGQIQVTEKQGYRFESLHLDTAYHDTLKMAISLPEQVDVVKNERVIPPGIIGIHIPEAMQGNPIKLNGKELGINEILGIGKDSLLISIGALKEMELELSNGQDTIKVRNTPKQQAAKISIQLMEKEGLQERFYFHCSDFISWIDTSKIILRNTDDSSLVDFEIDYLANQFEIRPKKHTMKLYFSFSEGAITGKTTNISNRFQKELQWKQEREYGDLTMLFSDTIPAGIVQVIEKANVIRELSVREANRLVVSNLLPGEYTFKVLLDRNENGKWDPISPETKTLAEEVLLFNDSIKIRANWEIESTFKIP